MCIHMTIRPKSGQAIACLAWVALVVVPPLIHNNYNAIQGHCIYYYSYGIVL